MNITRVTALSLLTLASVATQSQAGEVVIITQHTPLMAAPQNPWWLEASAFYGFASKELFKSGSAGQAGHVDSYAGDLTLGRDFYTNAKGGINSWDLRLGYGYGSNSVEDGFVDSSGSLYKEKAVLHRFYLMPGYRYTMPFNDSWSGFVGINLGVSNSSIKSTASNETDRLHAHKSDWGFAYSAEIGLKYQWCENWYAFAAYQFQGSTNSPVLHCDGERMSSRPQTYNTVRLGIGWDF